MLFSVVVPVYNVEKYLDECVNSIIEQSKVIDNDLEVLLVDDGSTDNSGKIQIIFSYMYAFVHKKYFVPNWKRKG